MSSPFEIARETLKQLSARQIAPTPENYRALYERIAGRPAAQNTVPEDFLRSLAQRLPRDTPEQQRLARAFEQSIGQPADSDHHALWDYLASLQRPSASPWNELIGQLLRQWEARQAGWTTARKRESLERVLSTSEGETLFARLQGLVSSWARTPAEPPEGKAEAAELPDTPPPLPEPRVLTAGDAAALNHALRALLHRCLHEVVPASLAEQPALIQEAAGLASLIHDADSPAQLQQTGELLRRFALKLEMAAGDTAEVRTGLLNLLRLLLQNIDELVLDDQWLHGQIEILRSVLDQPAELRRIDDAERRLKDVIYKQSQLKHELSTAQHKLKALIARFIDQLADFTESTDQYHNAIGDCARRISSAEDVSQISDVLGEVMRQTRNIQVRSAQSREELLSAQSRVQEAEAHIVALQAELDATSRLVTHDPLTGAMNRRGLEELFAKESARAQRRRSPLCLALLDLDNFKQLNDTHGHQRGDEALTHLVRVVRDNLRPQDGIARYGGEEFILLYPDTELPDAAAALTRLQRALTTAFFLIDHQKVLITFSAGVTPWRPGENLETVARRADEAMYRAKQSGKNRVEIEPAS